MADEENPLGGGPFGVGPFGPLVPTAAAAVAAFSLVAVTISVPLTKTLFYQSHVNPPPTHALQQAAFEPAPDKWMPRWQGPPRYVPPKLVAQPFVPKEAVLENTVTPDKWLLSWKGPPKYQPNRGPFATGPLEPPAVVDNINAATGITTGGVSRKTLFYQSRVAPVGVPAAEVVITTVEWVQPLSRAVARAPTETGLYTPFVPREATLENTQTPDKWLQPFKRQVAGPFPVHTQPVTAYPAAPQVTPAAWMPVWTGPPQRLSRLLGGQPFVPREAVLENTVDQGWRVPLSKPAAAGPVWRTQPFYGYPYAAASNLTTTLEWQIAWQGPPRFWPPKIVAQPFVPKEATLENTVDQGWRVPLSKAVPARPVWWTQPFFGYPYVAASNLTTTLEWQIQWQGPPRYWPLGKPYQPFVPKEAVLENTQTPDKWLEAWQGPPRQLQRLQPGAPFVPKEATLENTQTPDKWLYRFEKAVPVPPVRHTQPFFGYPYLSVFVDNTTTIDKWQQPLSTPRAATRLAVSAAIQPLPPQPQLSLSWQQPFSAARKLAAVKHTQPVLGYAQERNLTTTLEWLQRWRDPPRLLQRLQPGSPFVPKAAVFDVQTPDKWMQRWQGPPRFLQRLQPGFPFVAKEAVRENTQTPDKWLYRFQQAVPHGWPTHTQPFFGYPYVDQYPEGGPADEDERIVCVPSTSRVATAPALLRVVAVPLQGREATVPMDRSCSAQVVAEDDVSDGTGSGYYGRRYYGRHYYGPHYWGGSLDSGGSTVTESGEGYFGHRYFAGRYFGPHYWGGSLESGTTTTVSGYGYFGGRYFGRYYYGARYWGGATSTVIVGPGVSVDLRRVVCVPYQSRVVHSNEYRDGRACHDT